ncbi:MAG: hypothetical protein LBH01_01125 [Verrucomicrobiales bacterium]|nr:hypothetical protein [Verrucomicrobiales bacterium]
MSTPLTSLGSANAYGQVQLWINEDEADYGDGLLLPIRITFESGNEYQSKVLGRGFWFPLMEARAYPYSERLMQVELLCGKTIFLIKDSKSSGQYYSANKKMTGVLDGNKFTLKQEDGWELRYKDGKIWQAQTDKGRVLTWYYRNNLAVEIKDERSGNSAVKIEVGTRGIPVGVSVNGKTHSFQLGKRPRIEYIESKKVIGAMDDTLSVWSYPDGRKDTYEFAVTQDLQPTLKRTDRDGTSKTYQWDAKTGSIVSDGDWKYKIENNGQLPKLRRYNDKGQEEFRIVDNRNGVVSQQMLGVGTQITESFRTPGPLYGRLRKIDIIDADGTRRNFFQAMYNERGDLLRTITVDKRGYSTTFDYDGHGKITGEKISFPTDSKLLASLTGREKELVGRVKEAEGVDKKEALMDLARFYLFDLLNVQKATTVVSQLDHQIGYGLRVQLIDHNMALSPTQKVKEYETLLETYPEQREDLEFLINMRKEESKRWASK